MAFWGVEVRPGKPYTHRHDSAHGRLRICQATLGNFNATVRSVVQCNVGKKSPIILCSLNPKLVEMCRLEIELEEEEEVVFSVLGQSGVHLSGYYLRSSGSNNGDESESYGEDIGESDSEDQEYDANGSEDKYESDFIDDGDFDMSSRSADKVVDKPISNVAIHRRLRKKHRVSDIDENDAVFPCKPAVKRSAPSIFDSEDENSFPIPVPLSKKDTIKNRHHGTASIFVSDDEDTLPISVYLSKKENVKTAEGSTRSNEKREDHTRKNKVDVINQDPGSVRDRLETNVLLPSEQDAEDSGLPKQKRKIKDGKSAEIDTKSSADEEQVSSMVGNTDLEQDHSVDADKLLKNKDNVMMRAWDKRSSKYGHPSASQQEVKKKKKKAKNHEKDSSINQEMKNPSESEKGKQSLNTRTLDGGLIIEEFFMGKPDAKRASDGSKVYVTYVGKLQNGKIFDSTVGRKPFKFKLGAGKVIEGWDLGINGMRVGGKRRITIPPTMGYGQKTEGEVPENSWLVYDVELVNVK